MKTVIAIKDNDHAAKGQRLEVDDDFAKSLVATGDFIFDKEHAPKSNKRLAKGGQFKSK